MEDAMMHSRRNPWAYKIDYDKATAQAELELRWIDNAIKLLPFVTHQRVREQWTLLDLALDSAEAAAALGLDAHDCKLLVEYHELHGRGFWCGELNDDEARDFTVGAARAVRARVDEAFGDMDQTLREEGWLKRDRRNLKANIARYKRRQRGR